MLSTVGCGVGTQTTSLPGWATVGSYGFWVSGACVCGVWAGAACPDARAATSENATTTTPRTSCFTSNMSASRYADAGSRVHDLSAVDVDGLPGHVAGQA